jgi:hypothetical protein
MSLKACGAHGAVHHLEEKRSFRFLSKLDEAIHAVRRVHPPQGW